MTAAVDQGTEHSPRGEPPQEVRRRPWSFSWRRMSWWGEIATVGIGYEAYSAVRGAAPTHVADAFAHGRWLWDVESGAGVAWARTLNELTTSHHALELAAGYWYGSLHFVATPLALAWLWWRRPRSYSWLRTALVTTTLLALVSFWLYPVAPPRLAIPGMTDTLVANDIMGAASHTSIGAFVNMYAAMPSLHIAWAFWVAAAIAVTTGGLIRRWIWVYPALTTFAVLATANHYVLDVVAGVLLVVFALAVHRPYAAGARAARAVPVRANSGLGDEAAA